jgi:hypothetical protein
MDFDHLVPGVIGAFVGVIGWLLVGLYIQRRQFVRQARNAARAVFFELDVNRLSIEIARDHGSYTPLDRTSFERLLPELATLLTAGELRVVVDAYMGHAGYQQAASSLDEVPATVLAQALSATLDAHDRALAIVRSRAFSPEEARAMTGASASETPFSTPETGHRARPERKGT